MLISEVPSEQARVLNARRGSLAASVGFVVLLLVAFGLSGGPVLAGVLLAVVLFIAFLLPAALLAVSDAKLVARQRPGVAAWPCRIRDSDYRELPGVDRVPQRSANAYIPGVLLFDSGGWQWVPAKQAFNLGYRNVSLGDQVPVVSKVSGPWRQLFLFFQTNATTAICLVSRTPLTKQISLSAKGKFWKL